MISKLLIFIFFLFLISCTSNKPLNERGWSKEERVLFIKDSKYTEAQKEAFINKDIKIGFDKSLVEGLFGKPNMIVEDSIWYYTDRLKSPLLRIEFDSRNKVKALAY